MGNGNGKIKANRMNGIYAPARSDVTDLVCTHEKPDAPGKAVHLVRFLKEGRGERRKKEM
jgi:hypothetical protein